MKLTPVLVAALLVLGACSTTPADESSNHAPVATPTTSTAEPSAGPAPPPTSATDWPRGVDKALLEVDDSDVESVALAWITLATTYDTLTDTNPADAMRRASSYLSPALAEYFTDETALRTDLTWNEAAQHQSYTAVTIERIDLNPPSDTDTTKHRDFEINRTWKGSDGYELPIDPIYVSVRLSQTPSGTWQISDIA